MYLPIALLLLTAQPTCDVGTAVAVAIAVEEATTLRAPAAETRSSPPVVTPRPSPQVVRPPAPRPTAVRVPAPVFYYTCPNGQCYRRGGQR